MNNGLNELNQRSLEIFKELVDAFVETGEPVGSRTLSRRLPHNLSPATIRNVMADLEDAGLLYSPHTSAGRIPTDEGMRLFVSALLEVGDIAEAERAVIQEKCQQYGRSFDELLSEAGDMLSGLAGCAGVVIVPKSDSPLKHIEFVYLSPGRALVVLVSQEGMVENRLISIPEDVHPSVLIEVNNYLNSRLKNQSLFQLKTVLDKEGEIRQAQLNSLASDVIEKGLAVWSGHDQQPALIVKGQSHLLDNVKVHEELDQVKYLLQNLDRKESASKLLDASIQAEGIQIFIGARNQLFDLTGCSLVISPYKNVEQKVVGAIGVIGPTRMKYQRIIPLVDYTAKVITKFLNITAKE